MLWSGACIVVVVSSRNSSKRSLNKNNDTFSLSLSLSLSLRQVLSWLELLPDTRPFFMTLYMHAHTQQDMTHAHTPPIWASTTLPLSLPLPLSLVTISTTVVTSFGGLFN